MSKFNENSSPLEAPCKGCKKRELGCHSTCPEYIQFRKELDRANELKRGRRSNGRKQMFRL